MGMIDKVDKREYNVRSQVCKMVTDGIYSISSFLVEEAALPPWCQRKDKDGGMRVQWWQEAGSTSVSGRTPSCKLNEWLRRKDIYHSVPGSSMTGTAGKPSQRLAFIRTRLIKKSLLPLLTSRCNICTADIFAPQKLACEATTTVSATDKENIPLLFPLIVITPYPLVSDDRGCALVQGIMGKRTPHKISFCKGRCFLTPYNDS